MFNRGTFRQNALTSAAIAGAIVLACAGCSSGGSGSNSSSSSSGSGGEMTGSAAAAHYGNTGGSVAGFCKAFKNSDFYNNSNDETGLAKYWDAIAKEAPKEIQDKTFSIAQVMDKEVKGDVSGLTDANSANVKAVTDWMQAHCGS